MPINPYLNRRPIESGAEFVGRDAEVRWLLERIAGPYTIQNCAITGLRRLGKSSLLRFVAEPDGARARYPFLVHDPERLIVAYIDLSLVGLRGQEEDDAAIILAIHKALHQARPSLVAAPPDAMGWAARWEALEETVITLCEEGWRSILLFDELTNVVRWSERLASALRSLIVNGRIAYVTASLHPLHELFSEGRMSALYNTFTTLSLGPLPPGEARSLLVAPAAAQGVHWPEPLTEALLGALGGQPDLLKMAGSRLWDQCHAAGKEPSGTQVLDALRADADALFSSMWAHLPSNEAAQAAMAAIATGQPLPPGGLGELPLPVALPPSEELPFGSLLATWVRRHSQISNGYGSGPRLEERWLALDGKRYQLTQTESDIVALLLEQRGRTVSREALQQAVWREVNPSSKALDTAIQRLRVKIEEDHSKPRWLLTVRGEGYAFVE